MRLNAIEIALATIALTSTAMMPSARPMPTLPCSMLSGPTRAVIRIERDTMLPSAGVAISPLSFSNVRVQDSLLARPGTPMPGARVRILRVDSATRSEVVRQGGTPDVGFIRVFVYGAGCEPLRWTDTTRFVSPGEVGYINATLAPREQWIGNAPLLIVHSRPYPGFGTGTGEQLASPAMLFDFAEAMDLPDAKSEDEALAFNLERRRRALAWARAHLEAAELEPLRASIRDAVVSMDWGDAERIPSRLRGTYRVDVESGDRRGTWFFRTHERPSYGWRGRDSMQFTTAGLLASPHIAGYRLVGYGAGSVDSIITTLPRGGKYPLVWLATSDRPTAPGNDARRELKGTFEFVLAAAPESLWDIVEPLVPPMRPADSAFYARLGRPRERERQQAMIPVTVRIDKNGGVRADTTVSVGTHRIRIMLQRLDTVATKRPWD